MSAYLSSRAIKGLEKIGDIMLPRNGEFPSFSETRSIQHIDDLAAYAPADDIKDLSMVLSVFSFLPVFILRWIVKKMEYSQHSDGPLASIFRQLDFGVRGLLFSCYYSGKYNEGYAGKDPLDIIGFSIKRVE